MEQGKKTKLYDAHKRYGGKIANYAGWALPIEFEGLMAEHEAVRNAAGIFDVSHMGEVEVKGRDAEKYLQYLLTNDISDLKNNQIMYSFMCNPNGGIVEDLLVYKFDENYFFLVINASNIEKDLAWMEDHIATYDVEIADVSDNYSEIAIQGPRAEEILQDLTTTDLSEIGPFYCKRDVEVNGVNTMISRTGYTGEDGFEIYLPNEDVEAIWDKLLEVGKGRGIKPAGLGARDTLRFEAGLPLYGNELSDHISPLEAGLGFFVKLNKDDFIGKEALQGQKNEGLKRKIIGFEMMERGIPRHGYKVMSGGKEIGFVTTGYYSPTLKRNIGNAMVDIGYSDLDTVLEIQIRKRVLKARVINKKFYNKNNKR